MIPINFDTVKAELGETTAYGEFIWRQDMAKDGIQGNDTTAKGRDGEALRRLLDLKTRPPVGRCNRRNAERKIYLDTILRPYGNTMQTICDFDPRSTGLTIGIMGGRVIRMCDILVQVMSHKDMICPPIDATNVVGWRLSEGSLLGEWLIHSARP